MDSRGLAIRECYLSGAWRLSPGRSVLRVNTMKIKSVEVIPYSPPLKKFFGRDVEMGLGVLRGLDFALVRICSDEGLEGVGEICTVFPPTGTALAETVRTYFAPMLIGMDPSCIAQIHARMDALVEGAEPAKAGVDMALHDLVGKSLGVPVATLLGGSVRDHIDLSYSIMFGEPEAMADLAASLVRDGFGTVKVKVGQLGDLDVKALGLIRDAVGPSTTVRVDANMAWSTPKQALRCLQRMRPFDIELAEQPLAHDDLDGMAFVRDHIDLPIMADESCWAPRSVAKVLRANAADVVSVYVAESGGLFRAAQVFALCEAWGIPCAMGSMPENGVGTAAQVHLGMAMPNLRFASDCCGSRYYETDLLTETLPVENGKAFLPTGAGLGVDIDETVLESWRTDR
ncbi:MAG: hypothetical protein CMO26_16095 [Thiotrichales bacterium]|nr:hypothetical protein [Thiotrichales bacterium]